MPHETKSQVHSSLTQLFSGKTGMQGFFSSRFFRFQLHSSIIIYTVSKPAAHIASNPALAVFLLKTPAIQPADADLSHTPSSSSPSSSSHTEPRSTTAFDNTLKHELNIHNCFITLLLVSRFHIQITNT